MSAVGVECTFGKNGRLRIHRLEIDGIWVSVEQGRQWLDQLGRHVLVMLPGRPVKEIVLRSDTMTWEMKNGRSTTHLI